MLGYLLLPWLSLPCEYEQKYWCDAFNSEKTCYDNIDCDTYNSVISVPDNIISKYTKSIKSLISTSSCDLSLFNSCEDSEWEDYYECVQDSNCEILLSPNFMSKLPEDTWIAVRPKGLLPGQLTDEEYLNYMEYQDCLLKCKSICEEINGESECLENCSLEFCNH